MFQGVLGSFSAVAFNGVQIFVVLVTVFFGVVFLLMWPIFGFMDALVLGLSAAVLEAIPFLGPIFSAVPALLPALGKGGMTPLWVVLAYIAIQALENNVITFIVYVSAIAFAENFIHLTNAYYYPLRPNIRRVKRCRAI